MSSGFDTRELDRYTRDLLEMAQKKLPKESKKFLKKSASKLTKEQKKEFKSCKIGTGEAEARVFKKFKTGKVYKRNGLNCRAFLNTAIEGTKNKKWYSYGAMLNNGYVVKHPKTGQEYMIPGLKFMENAESNFKETFYSDTEKFIDEIVDKL